jgi:hypothetical protein
MEGDELNTKNLEGIQSDQDHSEFEDGELIRKENQSQKS